MTRYHKNRNKQISKNTLDVIFRLLNENSYTGLISVGSGEPLLYQNIDYFINSVLGINDLIKLRMLTNGMALSPDGIAKIE